MGRRRRNPHPARPMARLRTHARSTEDETRSAADDISQGMPACLPAFSHELFFIKIDVMYIYADKLRLFTASGP